MNVALFVRVSTKQQVYDRQVNDLITYANRQNHTIVATIHEQVSGSTSYKDRPAMQELLSLAKSGQVEKILVTEVSRLGRKTSDILRIIEFLTEQKISVFILNYNLETLLPNKKLNPVASILFTLLAEFSRLEKETLKDRIISGLEQAKKKGVKLGRPQGSIKSKQSIQLQYKNVISDLNSGLSIRKISKLREVSINTVQKVKQVVSQM
jgi:DNA invertase Pin-like site-specific DNA recombinase